MVSVKEMKAAIVIIFLLAFLIGMYLVLHAGVFIFIIGVLSITAGLAYTAGPFPLAYNGLGDLFVFLFFGFAGTIGTEYLHTHEVSAVALLASIPVGALVTNILVVNNYRDIEEDKAAGKITLAVIIGRRMTRIQYLVLLFISLLTPFILFYAFNFEYWIFLPYITFPLIIKLVNMMFTHEGKQLNSTLELTAKYSALYGILFSAGLII
jgi:1,4-dihydroxy-2-naphthoate polyprenyltransferase